MSFLTDERGYIEPEVPTITPRFRYIHEVWIYLRIYVRVELNVVPIRFFGLYEECIRPIEYFNGEIREQAEQEVVCSYVLLQKTSRIGSLFSYYRIW